MRAAIGDVGAEPYWATNGAVGDHLQRVRAGTVARDVLRSGSDDDQGS